MNTAVSAMQALCCSRRRGLERMGLGALGALGGLGLIAPARGAPGAGAAAERWFTSSDGVRLHYTDQGPAAANDLPTLVLVPGWTMPAWIWQPQIEHFAARQRVIAFDPRGQGSSAVPTTGYTYARRAQDIRELLAAAQVRHAVLVGWSLGVLECLQLMHDSRQAGVALPVSALVLVDNSVGEGEPPKSGNSNFFTRLRRQREAAVREFVRGMFKRQQLPQWLDALTQAALRTPLKPAIALLSQGTPRSFWRESLYATELPVLYAVTPRLAEQARLAAAHTPTIETLLFEDAGHALFVDDAAAFNLALQDFMARRLPTR